MPSCLVDELSRMDSQFLPTCQANDVRCNSNEQPTKAGSIQAGVLLAIPAQKAGMVSRDLV